MKRLLLFSVLCMAAVARAQDAFPDTPANHWAYSALQKLKADGILVGYPDGLFRGPRPASRYEMAVALHAAYSHLKGLIDGMTAQLGAVQQVNPNDTSNLRAQVDDLQKEVDSIKGYADDIANLKRAADTFELELEQIGVDVEAMKHELGGLQDRVKKLEEKKPAIDIHGDIDFWMGTSNSREDSYGLSRDGRLEGSGIPSGIVNVNPPVIGAVGLGHDMTILHEAAFDLASTGTSGLRWNGTVVVTDMFGNFDAATPTVAFGNQSDIFSPSYGSANIPASGLLSIAGANEDVYIQNLGLKVGTERAHLEFGRLGYKGSPYMLQRIDNTSYYTNDRWDNGEYYFDGAILGFNFGAAKLDILAGRNSGIRSAKGVEINPMRTGTLDGPFSGGPNAASGARFDIDRSVGANLNVGLGRSGHLSLGYLLLQSDTTTPIDLGNFANQLAVYGGDLDYLLKGVKVEGGYHKSDLQDDGSVSNGSDNGAWNVRVSTDQRHFSLYGEYRQVEANYLAPGDWGRLGILRDPTNIKGWRVGGSVDLGPKLKLAGGAEIDKGVSDDFAPSTFLDSDTNISRYDIRLDYFLRPNFNLFGAYEATRFGSLAAPANFAGSGDPSYRWATFGIGYGLSANSRLNIQYEFSDIDNDYQATNGASFHGGLLTTQLSIRF